MTNFIHGEALIQAFETFAPKYLAFENDKIGLLIGTLNKRIKKVMVTLDVLENVVDEAVEKKIDLIIAHHPVIFAPLAKVLDDRGQGKIVSKCIKHDIAVYAAHTNLDIAEGGVNDLLAEKLRLEDVEILVPTYHEKLFKLSVFTPESHARDIRQALGSSGAGFIGNYSHCSFNTSGLGMFQPEEGSSPYLGQINKLESVAEVKIETIVQESKIKKVIATMLKAHPYEEVAYDIYPLENKGKAFGLGRIGRLPSPLQLKEFAEEVKQIFSLDGVRVIGDLTRPIEKVAVLGGDGNKYLSNAIFKGADVLITGDVYYHTAHDALLMRLNVIDAGHHIESVMKAGVAQFLQQTIKAQGKQTEVYISEAPTNPFQFM